MYMVMGYKTDVTCKMSMALDLWSES